MKMRTKAFVGLGLIVALTLFFGMGATRLETKNNQDSELPDSDEIVKTNDLLEEVFGEKDIIMVGLRVPEGDVYTPATMEKALAIIEELKLIDGVLPDEILSLPTFNNITAEAWGLQVGEYITKDQAGDPAYLAQVKAAVKGDPLLEDVLVSANGQLLNIIANIAEGYSEEQVHAALVDMKTRYEGPEQILLAGDPVQQKEIDLGIKEDLGLLLPLALVLILAGFWLCFRSFYGVLLPFLVVVLSIVWTMGAMGWLGLPVTVVSSVVPILMIAVSSSYGIHVLFKYYEERAHHHAEASVKNMLKRIAPAILMTGFTSSVSALTLIVFKVTSIRDFGIISAVGIVNIVIISLVLLPSLLTLFPSRPTGKGQSSDFLARLMSGLTRVSVYNKRAVLAGFVGLIALSVVGLYKLEIGNDFIKFFPEEHTLRTTFDTYNAELGGARYIDIMFDTGEPDGLKNPELLRQMVAFEQYGQSLSGVGYVTSFTDVIKKINQELHGGDEAYYEIPATSQEIAQYLLLYAVSGSSGTFEQLVDQDYQRAKIRMMLTTSEQNTHTYIYESLKAYNQEQLSPQVTVAYGGEVMFWLSQIKYIVMGKLQNILLSIVIIMTFCVIVFRSFKYGVISAIPMIGSSLMTFGLMGFLGIRLEIGTAVITAIGIGIGIDFAIHYLMRYRQELAAGKSEGMAAEVTMNTAGRAILYDVFSNLIGFMVFVFSGFLPIQNFGWLISFTMITVAIGTLVLFPALLSFSTSAKTSKKTAPMVAQA
ncbi:efflux RND transporter permease subunit [Marinoscillum furvescens]|uniref:Putative RND superfamily exporter protein n=1 Tax=Marinoscillum furvescens DSM 4134 TaxID=1122208 RepID=A0A3D9KWY6_MARFU|nr:MMPL family transporter [Marinoscillum furvescens]RED93029.1 putative RND superfamily exporter protein [Marinoscillum furvescens DSM 4134]